MKFLLALMLTASLANAGETNLIEQLEPLRKMLGAWRGEFKNSTPDKPVVDIMQWERALNGQAIRITHAINDGVYGGETLITWDKEKSSLIFHYFTTAGFRTTGTIKLEDGKTKTHEIVTGTTVSEVRSVGELKPDGAYHIKSERLKNGVWEPGRETTYKKDPSAAVKFR